MVTTMAGDEAVHDKRASAEEAVARVRDGDTLAVVGSGGGLLEPDLLLRALGRRFEETGHPRDLTLVHAFGIGDRAQRGLTPLARPGLLRRVVAGHWGQTRPMAELAERGAIEAYNLPLGIMTLLHRELAGGRPGLITEIGLGTFVDPRVEGGRMNDRTTEDIVEVISLGGREYLWYKPYRIDVAFIRGSRADPDGYLTLGDEAFYLDSLALAGAARASGGMVVAQVKHVVPNGTLRPKEVKVPGVLVDHVVEHPEQWQSYESEHDDVYAGLRRTEMAGAATTMRLDARKVIARRAVLTLEPGMVANLGVGVPDGVGTVLAEEGCDDLVTLTFEHGIFGGVSAPGIVFGAARNHRAVVDAPDAIDFYHGGGLDRAFLGFAELDKVGNANVSKYNGTVMGSGGFPDIAQSARTVAFCGTLTTGGFAAEVAGGSVRVTREGSIHKFVRQVGQVTFNGSVALQRGHRVLVVTERAVLELSADGWRLVEVAPGWRADDIRSVVDIDLLASPALREMDAAIFAAEPMGLRQRWAASASGRHRGVALGGHASGAGAEHR